MKKFFRQVLVTALSMLLTFAAISALLTGILLFTVKSSPAKLTKPTVLHIKLAGNLVEYVHSPRPGDQDFIDLVTLKKAIRDAQEDRHIRGIYLEVGYQLSAGWSSLAEIRETLAAFKETGKFITAYGQAYMQQTYYLTSLADEIVMHPAGHFVFNGLSLQVLFYKGLLDKLEITPQIFRAGPYKSAVEPFTSHTMSPANKRQYQVMLNTVYNHLIDAIAAARCVSPRSLRKISHKWPIMSAEEAHRAQLITHIAYAEGVETLLRNKLSLDEDASISYIRFSKYAKIKRPHPKPSTPQIAVLVAAGPLTDDTTVPLRIGSKSFVKNLNSLKQDPDVKAIVIRINSPGGSALIADTLWEALMRTRDCKPLVASMADVAASGGYYLASACHHIVAHAVTLTGSIGVFGLYFSSHALLKNKLGITLDGVKTAPSADLFSGYRALNTYEAGLIQRSVDSTYRTFLERVATGRSKPIEAIAAVAGGRVWPGVLAQAHGLVDQLGGLEEAIAQAASLAGITDTYTVSYWPKPETWLGELWDVWSATILYQMLCRRVSALHPYAGTLHELSAMRGIQARLPYSLEIS
ncbi:MAG: signal peptide peptidase SppA [Bacteroidota bacterium]